MSDLLIDNPLVQIHFIIVMIWWTGLAPWEFEFPFPGSLTSAFPVPVHFDAKLPGEGEWNSHGARPVHLIITMIKWIWTSGLSMENSLYYRCRTLFKEIASFGSGNWLKVLCRFQVFGIRSRF